MFEEKRDIETMKHTTTLGGEVSQLLSKITELSQKLDQRKDTQQMGPCPNCVKYKQLLESTEQRLHKFDIQKPQSHLESDDVNEELKWDHRVNKEEVLHQKMNEMSKDKMVVQAHNDTLKRQVRELEETVSHLTAQLVAYKEDFENERRDRERAQGTISELRIQIQQMELLQLRSSQRTLATTQPTIVTPIVGAAHHHAVQNTPYQPVSAARYPAQTPAHYSAIGSYINSNDSEVQIDSDGTSLMTARSPQRPRGPQTSRGSQPVASSQPVKGNPVSQPSMGALQARGPVYQCDGGPNRTATDGEDSAATYTPTSGTMRSSPSRDTNNGQISVKGATVCVNSSSDCYRGNDTITEKVHQDSHRCTRDLMIRDSLESDHVAVGASDTNGHSQSDTLSCPICHQLFQHLDHYQLLLHMEQHASRAGRDATILT